MSESKPCNEANAKSNLLEMPGTADPFIPSRLRNFWHEKAMG
jgi:hypothetical protein